MTTTAERGNTRNLRWNFSVNLLDISFFMLGASLVSRETVVPLLVSELTNSTIAIGLISAVYSMAIYFPQLVGAGVAASMTIKKPFVMFWGGIGERGPFLLMGLAVLLLAEPAPLAALVALGVLFAISGASSGFATPAWFDMIAKAIPVELRGRYTGLGHGLGALMGVAGAAVIGLVLERLSFPYSYALLFMLAFVAMAISWVGLALNREPPSESVHPPTPLTSYLRSLPSVLRRDVNFTRFVAASSVLRVGTMAGPFFLVYGAQRFGLGGAEVGLLTGVLIGTQALLNPLWGALGDRLGHKASQVAGAAALGAAALAVWFAPSWPWLVLAFVLLGAFLSAETASFLPILTEFSAEADRPTYIGLANTLLTPVTTLAPLVGGWLAASLGYPPMFALAALVALGGAGLLALLVREPRQLR
jgi:MFS family permease